MKNQIQFHVLTYHNLHSGAITKKLRVIFFNIAVQIPFSHKKQKKAKCDHSQWLGLN